MIKFFRNIRQNLLNEGKTSKYLKYAIGEIVLVVIGILIALSINNWNDQRKAKIDTEAIRQSNLQEVYHDLQKDVLTLDTIIQQLQVQKEASAYVIKILESDKKDISDSLKFFQNMYLSMGSVAVNRTKNTWDNLNTSGQLLTLKEDTMIKKLFDYYTYYDSRIKNFNELPQEVRLKFRKSGTDCYNLENADRLLEGRRHGLIHPNSSFFSCFLNSAEMHNDLIAVYISSGLNVDWFTELKALAQSNIGYMEQNLRQEINLDKTP